ncbi:relaxase/mobilization nuclease domain-containing protein [Pedobacter soli]|uniref:Relaxase/Mobilisation nuclease domain-containing protein n=1 Tax=Pedobacter soli TaxID=390242 RepID=A0A1G6PGC3_9SPHI|nr:relaxase/mobilization nuclease domain-containing protein [Pedobacter soli]SDC78604.1 Relaxase/Mobilisation nuclease domain-containing protein [Pedobacter soli]
MIVEFLSTSNKFSAVSYNGDKLSSGRAELLCVKNFQSLQVLRKPRVADYKAYLRMIGSLNPKVKNKQLHVSISVEKSKCDKHALMQLGEKWLEKMGYSNNPYLIYFHKDTANNHIHMVSVRVDKNRKAIPSRYEKLRGTMALHDLIGFDAVAQAKSDANKALTYGFSNIDQFVALLKCLGYSSYLRNSSLHLVRHHRTLHSIDLHLINNLIGRYQPSQTAQRALQGIFNMFLKIAAGEPKRHPSFWHSYLKNNYKSDLGNLLSEKLNINIVYHRKNKEASGFTVINHNTRRVHQGEDIVEFDKLVRRLDRPEAFFDGEVIRFYENGEVIRFYENGDAKIKVWQETFSKQSSLRNDEPEDKYRKRGR